MLYEIKALKAPWPAGVKVGDVIDMPYLPAWAEGKCSVALDNAEADFVYEPKEEIDDSGQAGAKKARGNQDRELAILQAVEQLQEQLAAEAQARAVAVAAESTARVQYEARLTAALEYIESLRERPNDDRAAPATKTREDLNAEAEKLGIKVDGRWSDERVAEEIAKAAKK